MDLHSIGELKNIKGKRVLIRVDFNVPMEYGKVADDARIKAALPTIKLLVEKGAKVILMTHFGRPRPVRHPERSAGSRTNVRASARDSSDFGLRMTVALLSELLKKKVQMAEQWDFAALQKTINAMKAGGILILPNLRLHPGEEKNREQFARELAELGQIYVNEAFSVCHRKHASVVGVPKLLPMYAGLRLMEEIRMLNQVLHEPKNPLIVLMGGGK